MRVINGCILAGTALASLCGNAYAQDLFGSTNTTTHNYNYVEAQYLVNIDATPPVLASVLLDVWNNWSIKGEFFVQDMGNIAGRLNLDPSIFDINAKITTISVGGLYHREFPFLKRSDWIAGFLVGQAELSIEAPQPIGDSDENFSFQELYGGIRKTLASSLEGEVTLNYVRSPAADTNDFSADIKLVYRVARSFDVALAGNEIGSEDGNIVGIGLRYTW